MFRKYEKTFRVKTPKIHVPGKLILSDADKKALLTGQIVIEEKIDGANVGIIGSKNDKTMFRLQKRGSLVDTSEHPQFQRFKAWTMERFLDLAKLRKPYIIYGEFMWATHHIFYDALPDWFICFDVWDGTQYVDRHTKEEFCKEYNLEIIPLIYEGYVDSVIDIENKLYGLSAYSTDHDREGIVIKNHRKQMRAKLVRPEFVKEIDEDGVHWTTKWDPSKINKLKG